MSNIITYDPFVELREFQRQLFGDDLFTPTKALHSPTTDVWTEDDKQLVIEAHLPNFEQKDIDVNVDDSVLVIRAEKHEQERDKKKQYVIRESSSSFYRRVKLPEIADKDNVKAHMKNGILTVTVPFKELPAPKKIAIETKK
jgi:HSP20 family protein